MKQYFCYLFFISEEAVQVICLEYSKKKAKPIWTLNSENVKI